MNKGIVLGIIFLFVMMNFTSISGFQTNNQIIKSSGKGDVLYVGGSGPGNYSIIQDAINDAVDGDTVFVYDDSSPYYEWDILIDKTINLIGEDKDTTVIDGGGRGNVVHISANWVNITGFKICDANIEDAGVAIYSNYNIITGNNILDSLHDYAKGVGIYSNYNIITGNNISNNNLGIDIGGSNNTITGNNISNNDYHAGIHLDYSSNNTITGNNISNNSYGIDVHKSSSNTITDNTISNNRVGIFLYYSNNNNILGNSFFNDGLFVIDSYDNNVENNMVNGKPLVYLEDESDKVIDYEVGQVILVNCDNIIAENLNLSNTDRGIELWKTDNSMIRNNDFSNNIRGIYLRSSNSNNITGNNISNNKRGIYFRWYSNSNNITGNNISSNGHGIIFSYRNSNNTISGNNISNNDYYGIRLYCSSGNTITGNNISNNGYGIYLSISNCNTVMGNTISNNDNGINLRKSKRNTITGNDILDNWDAGIYLWLSSDDNIIYHNNLINNSLNAHDECNNIWDDGKYGNYWSDYEERYPDAKPKSGKPWMWDTPYEISGGNNTDNCPLVKEWPNSVSIDISKNKAVTSNMLLRILDRFPLL